MIGLILINPNHSMQNPNEQIIKITPSGVSIKYVDLNHFHIDFGNIKSVGIENIVDVVHHTINTIYNSTSHLIQFRNGGEATFAYNDMGQLVDLCAIGVNLLLGQNSELIFSINSINTSTAPPKRLID